MATMQQGMQTNISQSTFRDFNQKMADAAANNPLFASTSTIFSENNLFAPPDSNTIPSKSQTTDPSSPLAGIFDPSNTYLPALPAYPTASLNYPSLPNAATPSTIQNLQALILDRMENSFPV
ncbi:unnamed protein product [Sphagnum balticum]